MCLLIISNNCRPDSKVLKAGEEQNPDGIGVAYRRKKSVFWKKGISMYELEDILETEKPPFIVHFRLASAGGNHPGLCHPFPITKDFNLQLEGHADAVIAHNGHMKGWEHLALSTFIKTGEHIANGPWSDTRLMSWLVAHNGPNILSFLNEKVAYMTHSELKIFNQHLFSDYGQTNGLVKLSYDPFDVESEIRRYNNWFLREPSPSSSSSTTLAITNAETLNNRLRDELDSLTIKTIQQNSFDEEDLIVMAERLDDTTTPSSKLFSSDARVFE